MTTSVAPNADNTLTVPVRRLPLGVPIPTEDGPTRWKVWIPTALGGFLKITHTGATQIDIQQPLGTSLGTGTAEATTFAKFGDCWVIVAGASGTLSATLVQKAWSRVTEGDPNAAPLLPYNFFYWPADSSGPYAQQASDALMRYATAVGKNGPDADDWEGANHQAPGAPTSDGHCHNAAPASALFEQPAAQTINGAAFTEEEMELLATEWFGNFGKTEHVWSLKSAILVNKPGRWDLLGYLKPGGPKDRQALISGLGSEYRPTDAVSKADECVSQTGGEAQLPNVAKQGFGQCAAGFFSAIQANIMVANAPLLSNMRAYEGREGPGGVWNQIYFYYEATFAETWPNSPQQDDHDINLSCNLYCNIDKPPPSTGLPGTVSNNVVTPGTSSTDCWLYKHVYRMVFDDQGQPNAGDSRNEWVSLQNDKGEELYAPTNLDKLSPPGTAVDATKTPKQRGNPALGAEFLSYVKINARYT